MTTKTEIFRPILFLLDQEKYLENKKCDTEESCKQLTDAYNRMISDCETLTTDKALHARLKNKKNVFLKRHYTKKGKNIIMRKTLRKSHFPKPALSNKDIELLQRELSVEELDEVKIANKKLLTQLNKNLQSILKKDGNYRSTRFDDILNKSPPKTIQKTKKTMKTNQQLQDTKEVSIGSYMRNLFDSPSDSKN